MSYRYNDDSNRRCCRFICGFIIGLCIVAAATLVIAHIVVRPKPPIITVSSVTVSGWGLGQNFHAVSGNFQLSLRVMNQDKKMAASYMLFRTAVYYKNYQLSVSLPVRPFTQPKDTLGTVTSTVNVNGLFLQEPVLVLPNGYVMINIRVQSDVAFKGGFAKSRHYHLQALCDGLQIGFTSGLLAGGDRSCAVHLS